MIAGLAGGVSNAVAGGATLFTFPVMMAVGLPPITANASNALAVSFGNLMGAWGEREKLPPFTPSLWGAAAAAVIGGFLGAMLLIATPDHVFKQVVPALIGIATLIFALAKPIQKWVALKLNGRNIDVTRALLVLPASIYGGYFGAGLGIVLLALFGATSTWELRSANALKNTLGVLANAAAIILFISQNLISWPETIVMLCACFCGGYVGARLLKIVPLQSVRTTIVIVGIAMTIIYAYKFWF